MITLVLVWKLKSFWVWPEGRGTKKEKNEGGKLLRCK